MQRSICYCEPAIARAGDVSTWKFIYTPGTSLPKNTKLKFDMLSTDRNIDWQLPSTNIKRKTNTIYAHLKNGETIQAKKIDLPDTDIPQFEFVLPSELKSGQPFTIVVGAKKGTDKSKEKSCGNMCQMYIQRRRSFLLYIDSTGKGNYEESEVFNLDIRGNKLDSIRVLTPSFVAKNKRFDVIVRFEDEHGNLTSLTDEDTLIELHYQNLRENLNWKLFVPETGFITLPNLYFNEEGIYKIQLRNLSTGDAFYSSPIKCFTNDETHLFWGLLHGESERVDSTENIENCLRYFRDDMALNFFASSCFEDVEETATDTWKLISQNITDFNEADRFLTMQGFQWHGDSPKEGIRQIIYNGDNKPLLRKKDSKSSSLKRIYKNSTPGEIISIPSFTMGKGFQYDFSQYSPEFERVVEIYNAWGSSECTAKAGNTLPINCEGGKGVKESSEGSVQNALKKNCRFGFVAGGLDDRGIYEDLYESDQDQYTPGLTAIITGEHSRESLLKALYNRSCYATTGERIILGFFIANIPMGQEVTTKQKPGFVVNRHISGYVAGTSQIKTIEIIRNSKVIETIEPEGVEDLNFAFDDMTPIEKHTFDGGKGKVPFVYYYIRVTQEDDHIAWSSPIWIDVVN